MGEQDESTGNPGQVMKMSLHTLSDAIKRKTITLTGWLDGEKMLILVILAAQIVKSEVKKSLPLIFPIS